MDRDMSRRSSVLALRQAYADRSEIEARLRETWAEAWTRSWQLAIEWSATAAYEAGRMDGEAEVQIQFDRGFEAGVASIRGEQDAIFQAGYRDALTDQASVIERLKRRLAECENR